MRLGFKSVCECMRGEKSKSSSIFFFEPRKKHCQKHNIWNSFSFFFLNIFWEEKIEQPHITFSPHYLLNTRASKQKDQTVKESRQKEIWSFFFHWTTWIYSKSKFGKFGSLVFFLVISSIGPQIISSFSF